MKNLLIIALLVAGVYGLYTFVVAPHYIRSAECPACEGTGQMIVKEAPIKGGVKIEFGPTATLDASGQMQITKPQTTDLSAPRERKVPCKWCVNGSTTPVRVEEIKKELSKTKGWKLILIYISHTLNWRLKLQVLSRF